MSLQPSAMPTDPLATPLETPESFGVPPRSTWPTKKRRPPAVGNFAPNEDVLSLLHIARTDPQAFDALPDYHFVYAGVTKDQMKRLLNNEPNPRLTHNVLKAHGQGADESPQQVASIPPGELSTKEVVVTPKDSYVREPAKLTTPPPTVDAPTGMPPSTARGPGHETALSYIRQRRKTLGLSPDAGNLPQPGAEPPPAATEPETRTPWGGMAGSFLPAARQIVPQLRRLPAPGPLGLLKNMALAGIGAELGDLTQQGVEVATKSPFAPKNAHEAATSILQQGAFGVAGEGLGGAVSKGIEKGLARFSGSKTAAGNEADKFLTEPNKGATSTQPGTSYVERAGVNPGQPAVMLHERVDSTLVDIAANIAEYGIGGSKVMKNYNETYRAPLVAHVEQEIIDSYGRLVQPHEASKAIVASLDGSLDAAKSVAQGFYKDLDRRFTPRVTTVMQANPNMVPTGVVDRLGNPIMKPGPPIPTQVQVGVGPRGDGTIVDMRMIKRRFAEDERIANELNMGMVNTQQGFDLIKQIRDMPDYITFGAAQKLRSTLQSAAYQFKVNNPKAPATGVMKTIAGELSERIYAGLNSVDMVAAQEWKLANNIERNANATFNSKFIRSMMRRVFETEGANAQAAALNLMKQSPDTLEALRKATAPSDWAKFQNVTTQSLLGKASRVPGEIPTGDKLMQQLFGDAGFKRETMDVILGKTTTNNVEKLARTLQLFDHSPESASGRVWIQLKSASVMNTAIVSFAGAVGFGGYQGGSSTGSQTLGAAGAIAGAAAILSTPHLLAKMLTSQRMTDFFLRGISMPAGSKEGITLLGKVVAGLGNMTMSPTAPPAAGAGPAPSSAPPSHDPNDARASGRALLERQRRPRPQP